MNRIVDRRFDSKKKSTVNRGRFIRRYKEQIRRAVGDAISRRRLADLDNGGKVGIPAKDISEPQFQHGRGGRWETVSPGNDRFTTGDQIDRPTGGAGDGGSNKASQDGEGMDDFVFTLTREEFLDIFFDDLALPNLVKTQLTRIDEFRRVRAGHTQSGVPTNINVVRSLRGALGRRIAVGSPFRKDLRAAEEELEELEQSGGPDSPRARELRETIARLRERIERVPFLDTFDLRYNNRVKQPMPSTQAVMFCLMDVSGSMDEARKQIAKRFFMLLYLFLERTYKHIEVVFIRHHTQAFEVEEEDFFTSRETGGTVVSCALALMADTMLKRYSTGAWNIYGAQASDGDNWENDSPHCGALLREKILPLVQYYAYVEIAAPEPQNLWREYEKVRHAMPDRFAMQRIHALPDIYPVFRELFQKKLA